MVRLCVIILLVLLTACHRAAEYVVPSENTLLLVTVSIEPLAFLVEQIGGSRVRVEVIAAAGREPETFTPTPQLIAQIRRSRIFFRIGFPFEQVIVSKMAKNSSLQVVDLRDGIKLHTASLDTTSTHQHADGSTCADEHGHDNHIWLSPTCCLKLILAITDSLAKVDPANATEYRERADILTSQFAAIHRELTEQLAPHRGATILVVHPAYRYFCDDFGLNQRAIEFEGRSPRPQQLAAWLDEATAKNHPPVIIVQSEFSRAAATMIAESTRGTLVEHSPLKRDILANLRSLADIIAAID